MLRRLISLGCSVIHAGVSAIHRQPTDYCVVLYYHGVKKHQIDEFQRQIAWLNSHYEVISLRTATMAAWKGRCACITFDDGLDNVRQNALPVLRELRLPATVFVVPGNLGRTPQWSIEEDHPDRHEILSTAEQLREYPADLIEIGSHTMSHPNLTTLSRRRLTDELTNSKDELERILGREIISLSVPFGSYDNETLETARSAGYSILATCDADCLAPDSPRFVVGRFKVEPDDWKLEYRLKARGHYQWRRSWHELRRGKMNQGATRRLPDTPARAGISD